MDNLNVNQTPIQQNTNPAQQNQTPPEFSQAPQYQAPAANLKTDRSLIKYILLSLITFGIYGLVTLSGISKDVNTVCSKYDNKKTMNFWLVFFIITPFTLGIGSIVWIHKLCNRMGAELKRRGIAFSFGAGSFWGWEILGSLIVIGPFIFIHKFITASNLLNADYNVKG